MRPELPPLPNKPTGNELWQHAKGGIYRVLGLGYVESTLEIVVIYTDHSGRTWVRPHAEFLDRFRYLMVDDGKTWGVG